jgi:hypothetical protein
MNHSFTFFQLTVHDYPHISCTLHSLIIVYTVLLNKMRELNKSYFAGGFIFIKCMAVSTSLMKQKIVIINNNNNNK